MDHIYLKSPVKLKGSLIPATLIERTNRFLNIVNIEGVKHKSHLPDPGRLNELLIVGCKLLVRPEPKTSKRKTRYTTIFVDLDGQLISLVSTLPNAFVKEALIAKTLPMYKSFNLIRPEIVIGNHRLDFLLESDRGVPFYLEIKSVTFVENGVAKFPDSITKRGASHLDLLKKLSSKGYGAGVLFVCQRQDAYSFQPMWERDPYFSSILLDAFDSGVKVNCITLKTSQSEIKFNTEISVNLENPS